MLFTSESVTQGHPDKMADQISDAILDACLAQDPLSRVACETLLKTGLVVLAGEITTKAVLDYPKIVRKTVEEIGYADATWGFDAHTCAVLCAVEKQSPDIAMGVDEGEKGETFGTAKADERVISEAIREVFPLTTAGIIQALDLRRPQFRKTAAYGHFGRENEGFAWEKTDKAEALKSAVAQTASR